MLIGHNKQWKFLSDRFNQNQLSHAYLFTGSKGIGKRTFAVEFAKAINCLNKPNQSFGEPCKCINCQMITKNIFPDLMVMAPEDGGDIKISQIRKIHHFLTYKSYYGFYKTAVVDEAEKMNQEAQSCFLKTLEEPKGKTLIILVSSMPDALLPTIVSRCQTLKFFKPKNFSADPEKIKKHQEILKDFLLLIDSNLSEKFKYVKSLDLEAQNIGDILEVMQRYFRNLLFLKTGLPAQTINFDNSGALKKYSVGQIKEIINLIEVINNKLFFTNASPKLALEVLLMEI